MPLSADTNREIDWLFVKELHKDSDSLVSEVISVRSMLCLLFPNDREKIVTAFSDLLFSTKDLNEKAKRLDNRGKRKNL